MFAKGARRPFDVVLFWFKTVVGTQNRICFYFYVGLVLVEGACAIYEILKVCDH